MPSSDNQDPRSQTTKEAWVADYIRRARSVGFAIEEREGGCFYLPDEDNPDGILMVCVPCDCCDHTDGWHMEEVQNA